MWGLGPILIVAATGLIGMCIAIYYLVALPHQYPSPSHPAFAATYPTADPATFSQPILYYVHLLYSFYAVICIYFHYVVAVSKDPGYYSARDVERWWIRAGYAKGYYDGDVQGLRRVDDVKRERFQEQRSLLGRDGPEKPVVADHPLPDNVLLERTGVGANLQTSSVGASLPNSRQRTPSTHTGAASTTDTPPPPYDETAGLVNGETDTLPTATDEKLSHAVLDMDASSVVELVEDERPRLKAIVVPPGMRWCKKCLLPKPVRTHHCSVCKRCVMGMDHHCPWLANCVGHANHRHFLLFLAHLTVGCLYFALFTWPTFWATVTYSTTDLTLWRGSELLRSLVALAWILAVAMGVAVGGLASFQWWLASHGLTTIEYYKMMDDRAEWKRRGLPVLPNEFDLGWRDNLREFFNVGGANSWWSVVFPTFVSRSTDGSYYPTRGTYMTH
ncbi:zf-DHHC-domain-containing protein [Gonapodya prolifera JEL478]|uniref:Palmitoyltransferase n=1 Tax=Gonapodya prolifera (strain JEL478) TaxID=1344416 RepID=A0A139A242_GONPJ|nr:zf-DHHC-domain-containing protein [Gonapodya prolifera JEL478]|eukprot:KXS10860.1 zf-DHHC-domain-containing protein [Gonapodya prolifera JEL478]